MQPNFHNGIFQVDDPDILLGKPNRNNSEETYITCEYLLATLSLACKGQEQIVQIEIVTYGANLTRLILSGRTSEL